jgi:hypothetical protein
MRKSDKRKMIWVQLRTRCGKFKLIKSRHSLATKLLLLFTGEVVMGVVAVVFNDSDSSGDTAMGGIQSRFDLPRRLELDSGAVVDILPVLLSPHR